MADNEIRIPIQIDLINSGRKTGTGATNSPLSSLAQSSGAASGISGAFLVQSGRKLIAATGNSELATGIGNAIKYGTLGLRAATLDVSAIANIALDVATEAIKRVQEIRLERIERANQANQIDILKMQLGRISGEQITSITTNRYGRFIYGGNKS